MDQSKEFFFQKFEMVSQIGVSACGPTALLNVCQALKVEHNNKIDHPICKGSQKSRLRDYNAKNLLAYLISRIKAGTIHSDLIRQIEFLTDNHITGKFFTFDQRQPTNEFRDQIIQFMKLECVPILTENLFLVGNDAWHHQMAYGADQDFIYVSNPKQKIQWSQAQKWVASASWMIIPISQLDNRILSPIEIEELRTNPSWTDYSVLEQLSQIIQMPDKKSFQGLTIPWGGLAGITFFYSTENIAAQNHLKQFKEKCISLPFYPDEQINYFST